MCLPRLIQLHWIKISGLFFQLCVFVDAALFTKMLSDQSVLDLRKLCYKFPQADIKEFVELLKNGFYHTLPLKAYSIPRDMETAQSMRFV